VKSLTVLAAGHAGMADLGMITLVNQQPTWVAGAGWEAPAIGGTPPRGRTVLVLQTRLP